MGFTSSWVSPLFCWCCGYDVQLLTLSIAFPLFLTAHLYLSLFFLQVHSRSVVCCKTPAPPPICSVGEEAEAVFTMWFTFLCSVFLMLYCSFLFLGFRFVYMTLGFILIPLYFVCWLCMIFSESASSVCFWPPH